jgi:hypothetical protein
MNPLACLQLKREEIMSPKNFARCVAIVFALLSGAANSEVITFEFKGKVTYSTYLAPLGSEVAGTFAYDTDTAPGKKGNSHDQVSGYEFYQIPAPFVMSAKLGNHTIEAGNLHVSVWNDYGGNVEDMVDISAAPVVVDGTTFAEGVFNIRLASGPGHTNVFFDASLPRSFEVGKFNSQDMNLGVVMSDGSQTGTLLHFSIDSIKATSR